MASTKDKNGKWQWDDDDEKDIAKLEEARVRAAKRLQEDEKRSKPEPWDGKTERRAKDRRLPPKKEKETPSPKKSFWD